MRFKDFSGISMKKKILVSIITVVLSVGLIIPLTMYLISLSNSTILIDAYYSEENGSPQLLTVYANYGNSEDDGTYLKGYTIKLINPKSKEVIDELFIERETNENTPLPVLWTSSYNNCWLIQKPQFIQGDTGYLHHFGIELGKIRMDNQLVTTGYFPGDFAAPNYLNLTNKFNEKACLNLKDSRVFSQ